jgi:hypothetical protein
LVLHSCLLGFGRCSKWVSIQLRIEEDFVLSILEIRSVFTGIVSAEITKEAVALLQGGQSIAAAAKAVGVVSVDPLSLGGSPDNRAIHHPPGLKRRCDEGGYVQS